ncbi:MAG: site-specific DNA-methyltransferase [Anaerolineae bacterium]|nr:site-specific DNA-methyltransferase [Anaerolineae bacterium]
MVHLSEECRRLDIKTACPGSQQELLESIANFDDAFLVRLPTPHLAEMSTPLEGVGAMFASIADQLGDRATLIVFGETVDLVHVHQAIGSCLRFHLWIAVKREPLVDSELATGMKHQHVGALVYTKYDGQLHHTKTRLEYSYCPACQKTTKDYGGKKHTYHPYGTLISDVWRDISVNPEGDISPVLERFADLFGVEQYRELRVCDLRQVLPSRRGVSKPIGHNAPAAPYLESRLLNGDVLSELRTLPDNSIDFAFVDPPYNLKKQYLGYADDLKIADYFTWCDAWISEVARVLRPGATFALLNIPLWAVRHFLHMETILTYQNWIVWDALSFPVRMIMPAHYAILCFSKGDPRPLPGLKRSFTENNLFHDPSAFRPLAPLGEGYCLRSQCVAKRAKLGINDRGILSDIWWDVHRLKHNSRRVDHPCQLPPQLMHRLISLFTEPGEIVLDCFNGAGTTTLSAHQMQRRYIGIEREERYHLMAMERHAEIADGIDPFRKADRVLTTKNSPVARLKKQKYKISKKTLQLEVRRVAQMIGHLPTRKEMIEHGEYPIHYYDDYFTSWGEVCAAARTSGMRETREEPEYPEGTYSQKRLF